MPAAEFQTARADQGLLPQGYQFPKVRLREGQPLDGALRKKGPQRCSSTNQKFRVFHFPRSFFDFLPIAYS